MDLLSAIRSIRLFEKKEKLTPLSTIWGENLDSSNVLQEYPRPQMIRKYKYEHQILNGYWNYAFCTSEKEFTSYDGQILVPFSPESSLSGVNRQLRPDELLVYERTLTFDHLPEDGSRCLLHFGAVDQYARVYINHILVSSHIGGYLPFSVDITKYISSGDNLLTVYVEDRSDTSYHSVGKQKLKRGGMFYTAQSGIWQTVWLEWVPSNYITNLKITPYLDKGTAHVCLQMNKPLPVSYDEEPVICYVMDEEDHILSKSICTNQSDCLCTYSCYCDVDHIIPWTPDNPYLYHLKVCAGNDTVTGYFAMRSFTLENDSSGIPRFCLNHEPLFLNGVLDQGYWPDGLYTAPSDEALIFDIQQMKKLGFNMLRKHAKLEPARWYYHCDRLGMIVWQDMVNGGGYQAPLMTWLPTVSSKFKTMMNDKLYPLLCRNNVHGREEFIQECKDTVQFLNVFPCISTWVIFNEGWGQFDSEKLTKLFRELDKERLIDTASGWFDKGYGDFKSEHNYFSKQFVTPDKRAFVISEYGGYAHAVKGHTSVKSVYGYKICSTAEDFRNDFTHLMGEEIQTLISQGLCGAVYTQVSDIEEEVNGLMTYDRKICKL